MSLRNVLITVTNQTLPTRYFARSYPMRDRNNDGRDDKYEVPIYKVFIEGPDDKGAAIKKEWNALRFMPFWNDSKHPSKDYKGKARGYINSGLNSFPKQAIRTYIPTYPIHNTYSEYIGAIQLKGDFLIHAGPINMLSWQWGAAGCIEIIGSFNQFRLELMQLAGSKNTDITLGMTEIINHKKLFVEVQNATTPILKKLGEF